MKPELDINRPLFLQVKEAIEDDILAGVLQPDDQIPSNSQLVTFFGINPVTVHKGVTQLLDEGVVYKKRGLGLFVEPKAAGILQARRQKGFAREFVQPLVKQAQILGLSQEDLAALLASAWAKNSSKEQT